jgi:outer membrane protein
MRLFLLLFLLIFFTPLHLLHASSELVFYLEEAYKNNPKLNAERKNLKATKQNINISKSDFFPSLSLSGSVDSVQSTNKTNHSGTSLPDSSSNKETKKLLLEQKIFQGFQGYNTLKKSELEFSRANFLLKSTQQNTIFDAASAYFDLIYRSKTKEFNLSNVDLFERQVETDSARVQKGEITLTDLAQSESSLAGAKASFISSDTEFLTTKQNFKRIIGVEPPNEVTKNIEFALALPTNLQTALDLSQKNNPELLIAEINYQISVRDVNIKKAQYSPTASINFSKSESKDYSQTIDDIEEESVNATVSWPIIKGGKNYSSIKKSKFKKEQSNLILQDTTNKIKTDTTNAWALYQSANSILNSTKAQVRAAEIANEGISLEYDSGTNRTTLEVIQSRSLLLQARIDNAKAERDFNISKFRMLSVIGNLTLENIKSNKL